MGIQQKCKEVSGHMCCMEFLPLFLFRLALAYSLLGSPMAKNESGHFIFQWIDGLSIYTTYYGGLVLAFTKVFAIMLLAIGLATRIASVYLGATLLVVIIVNGWMNGITQVMSEVEVLVNHILAILTLIIFGAGKLSVDYWVKMKLETKPLDLETYVRNTGNGDRLDRYCRDYEDF